MSFESFGEFLAMGNHGPYVWSAYAISLAVLALNVALPILAIYLFLERYLVGGLTAGSEK